MLAIGRTINLYEYRCQGLAHLLALGVAPALGKRLARLGLWRRSLDLLLRPAAAGERPELIDAPVVDYGEQPGPDAAPVRPVARSRPPELEEGLLREVLGCLPLAHHPVRQRVGSPAVAVVEGGEGLGVALRDEGDQILVRQEKVLSPPIRHASILRHLGSAGSPRVPGPGRL